jgi:hypothetical protein
MWPPELRPLLELTAVNHPQHHPCIINHQHIPQCPHPTQQQDTAQRTFDDDRGNAFSLGARPLVATEGKQFKEKSVLEAMTKRAGAYDVFAPSGPYQFAGRWIAKMPIPRQGLAPLHES